MKKLLFICSVLFCISCQKQNSTELIESLNTKIDNWHLAASNAEFDKYFGFIADSGTFIGTDVTERWSKNEFSEFSKPYFDKGKAWSFTAKERTLRFNKQKTIAWFDEVLDTWMGDCRSTGVLSLNNAEWKLDHYQLSVTIDNELMPQFLEITKSK
jgi:hypothetical protein